MLSQENLKESIMTIIFGKDVPAEKIQGNVTNAGEELPVSSSTTWPNNRKIRARSVRIAKRAMNAKDVSTSDKEEKVPKLPLLNKINAPR